MLVYYCKRL